MRRGFRIAAIAVLVLAALFASAQIIRPERTNPPVDPARTLAAAMGAHSPYVAVVDRACRDCHSNATAWARYTRLAPLSWAMASGVAQGRKALNFSTWADYPPERQRQLLAQSCAQAESGKMPGRAYTFFYPEARLSAEDIATLCAAGG